MAATAPTTPRPPGGITAGARTDFRLEYKYLAPIHLLPELRAAFCPWLCCDEFAAACPDRQYTVRSIYYDNRRFDCYQEKVEGFTFKRKLRIRGYDRPVPDGRVFLEIKYKNQDYIGKSRAPVRWDRLPAVFDPGRAEVIGVPFEPDSPAAAAVRRFLYHYYRRRMLPVVLIAYEREAFYSRFDRTLRITFDKNVRSRLYPTLGSLYDDRGAKFVTPGQFVLEVKFFGSLPRWVRDIATRFELLRVANSKYARGIDRQRVEKKFLRGVGHRHEIFAAPGHPVTRSPSNRMTGHALETEETQQ
ncbi:MAG TPA: polyphosphate polymerase domain-containing protein [candidate division WOR-3 bacterium]|uniref:Polyphosphate polymerase domain-containing protein n=1 Tax=candidate division WOR-3 bacterium TaxID=2052148 RepID=A0A7V0XFG4_UNCW3|nr:polyphosphate polymerase domain-containing protein [candidate division WOR-3 bacterium]